MAKGPLEWEQGPSPSLPHLPGAQLGAALRLAAPGSDWLQFPRPPSKEVRAHPATTVKLLFLLSLIPSRL